MTGGVFLGLVEFREFVVFQPHCYRILVVIVVWGLEEEVSHYTQLTKDHFVPCHTGMFGRIRERSGGSENVQEGPRGSRRIQEGLEGSRRVWESSEWSGKVRESSGESGRVHEGQIKVTFVPF